MRYKSRGQRYFGYEQSDQRLQHGLAGDWIGDGSGLVLRDRSGYQNHGVLTSGPKWSLGPQGRKHALAISGSAYVRVPNHNRLEVERTDAFTIATRVYFNAASSQMICGKVATGGTYRGWQIFSNWGADNTLISFFLRSTVGSNELMVSTPTGSIGINTWYDLVITYDGSSTPGGIHIYINNVDQALTTQANTLSATIANTSPLDIGRR